MNGDDHLPPVDPKWVTERRREDAAGRRPPGQDKPAKLSSSALRTIETARAVLDLTCRGRHVARVLVPDPDVALPSGVVLQVACEARLTAGGGVGWWPLDGYVGADVVIAACHCKRRHSLVVNKLITESRGITPGKPKRMNMLRVAALAEPRPGRI